MPQLPPIELLEATHTFPCPYTFKVIGEKADDFEGRVRAAVAAALKPGTPATFTTRETDGGRHISVTVVALTHKSEDVHAVYHALHELKGLFLLF